ncbi:MAG: carbamoyltransferase N-terminal domain-containing protein [Elusimicrobiales bacterium]|nr:carbamoyltransferase N-terminal domain-containing protein [Elusimicrobiales bacterium]
MIILGISAYDENSSACLVINGKLMCALEEARVRRCAGWAGLPVEAVKACLAYCHFDLKDVDLIAVGRDPHANMRLKVATLRGEKITLELLKDRLGFGTKLADIKKDLCAALERDMSAVKARVRCVEHHKAHLAGAYLVSPHDSAICVSLDGFGDYVSGMRAAGVDNKIYDRDRCYYPHSLGMFYSAMAQFLGFGSWGGEDRVMELSKTGRPEFEAELRQLIKPSADGFYRVDESYFAHGPESAAMFWRDRAPELPRLFAAKVEGLIGKPREANEPLEQRHADIAASAQAVFEEIFFHVLNSAYEKYRNDKLCLSGGCARNALAVGRICEKTRFRDVYVPPAPHAGGTAIGAAYWIWNQAKGYRRSYELANPYVGPHYDDSYVEALLKSRGLSYHKAAEKEIYETVAGTLSGGGKVGWFQGRSPWGAWPLGGRCLLSDPRVPVSRELEGGGAAVMDEKAAEWFETVRPSPFMAKAPRVRPARRDQVPGLPGGETPRVQTVSWEFNHRFYALLEAFDRRVGVPMLVSAPLLAGEPLPVTPEQALECFEVSGAALLAINNFLVTPLKDKR